MPTKLTISISEYDEDIKKVVVPALQGGLHIAYKKYSKLQDLNQYTGGSKYPLTLLGHANEQTFKTGLSIGERVNGESVADYLLAKKLQASTFPFCLIAGCSGASNKLDGLYIKIANKLSIPTVASSTPIKISRTGEKINLQPQKSGIWRVYFPKSDERYSLHVSGRCDFINEILDKQEFNCMQGIES